MLTTLTARVTYNGNDATTSFDYPFKIWASDELELWITDAAGAKTQITSNYNLTGVGNDAGGSVTYPVSGNPLETGKTITLQRVVDYDQSFFDAVNNQAFQAEVLESAIDKVVAQLQQLKEEIDRSLRGALSSDVLEDLPVPVAGQLLAWNDAGDGFDNVVAGAGIIGAGDIGTTQLANAAVTTAKLANAAVTTAKLALNSVTGAIISATIAGTGLSQHFNGSLQVNVDDSSIEIVSDELRVKASGIVNAMLASANTTPGSAVIPIADSGGQISAGFLPDGAVVQHLSDISSAQQTSSSIIINDDSIPQDDEGAEIHSVSYTPLYSDSDTLILLDIQQCGSVPVGSIVFSIIDSVTGADAIAAGSIVVSNTSQHHFALATIFVAGNTTARTISVRFGPSSAATAYTNGSSAGRRLGGASKTSLHVFEIRS